VPQLWLVLKSREKEISFDEVNRLGLLLENLIKIDPEIKEVRRIGQMFAFDMESFERVERVVSRCLELGLISFWFLSHPYSF
jgi:acetylornithine/N-succinyldiaminopimelate aminotransferase